MIIFIADPLFMVSREDPMSEGGYYNGMNDLWVILLAESLLFTARMGFRDSGRKIMNYIELRHRLIAFSGLILE